MRRCGFTLTVIWCLLYPALASGLPEGGEVARGSATFDKPNAHTLNITASDNAIIIWQNFDIAAGETVRFIQPSSAETVLNQVAGSHTTNIAGDLSANAALYVAPDGNILLSGKITAGSIQIGGANITGDKKAEISARSGSAFLLATKGAVRGIHMISASTDVTVRQNNTIVTGLVDIADIIRAGTDVTVEVTGTANTAVLGSLDNVTAGDGSRLTVRSDGMVTLDTAVHQSYNLHLISGNAAVEIRNTVAMKNVTLTATNNITQTGAMSGEVLTAKTLNDKGGAITLDNAANAFTTVNLQARNAADTADADGAIIYREADTMLVGTITTRGNVNLTAVNGDINDEVDDVGADITGHTVTLSAIGAGNGLGTNGWTLDTDAQNLVMCAGSGGINLWDVNSVTVNTTTIAPNGSLILTAVDGITIAGNQSVTGTGKIHINADGWGNGVGTLTINDGVNITTENQYLQLIGADFVIKGAGAVNAGSGNIVLAPTQYDRTVGIGSGAGDFSVSNAEIGALSTTGPVTIGALYAGRVQVDGVDAGAKNLEIHTKYTINDPDDTGDAIVTSGTLTLWSVGAIGQANPEGLNIDVGTLNVTSTGGNDSTITDSGSNGGTILNVDTGGNGAFDYTLDRGDVTLNNVLSGTSITIITAAGAITGATTGNMIAAGTDSSLTAATTIGSSANPMVVNIAGTLGVGAWGAAAGNSVVINGNTSDNALTLLNAPPGKVFFNNVKLYPDNPLYSPLPPSAHISPPWFPRRERGPLQMQHLKAQQKKSKK